MKLIKNAFYKLITNSPNDVWTIQKIKKKKVSVRLLGKPVYRYTVYFEDLGITSSGDEILLIAQLTSDPSVDINVPFIKVKKFSRHQRNKSYIMPINVRIALNSEFDNVYTIESGISGYIDFKKEELFKLECYRLLFDKERLDIIAKIKYTDAYASYTFQQWRNLVLNKQFSKKELIRKGLIFPNGK